MSLAPAATSLIGAAAGRALRGVAFPMFLVGLCMLTHASSAMATSIVRTIPVGDNPQGVSSDGARVWVSNFDDDTVTRLDATTGGVTGTIRVGTNPHGVSSDGSNVWVANFGDDTVTKIDAATGRVVRTIPVGSFPFAISSDGVHVWVTNSGANTVSEIDAVTGGVVRTIAVGGGPSGVSSDGVHVWVANYESGTVTEIDATTGAVVRTIFGASSHPVNISSDGTHVWVTSFAGGRVVRIDAATGAVSGSIPHSSPVGLSNDGKRLWVANGSGRQVNEFDAATGAFRGEVTIPPHTGGDHLYAVSSDGRHAWTVNAQNDSVIQLRPTPPPRMTVEHEPVQPSTGDRLTFIATITGSGSTPTGTVTWSVTNGHGEEVPCSATGDSGGTSGIAVSTCAIDPVPAGDYLATATYPGDTNYDAVSASDANAHVAKASPELTIADDSASFLPREFVTYTATLRGRGGIAPTGPVAWTVVQPGGEHGQCRPGDGPTASGDVLRYSCAVPRGKAGSAQLNYGPGDDNYEAASSAPHSLPVVQWRSPSFSRVHFKPAEDVLLRVRFEDSVEARGTGTITLTPPLVAAGLAVVAPEAKIRAVERTVTVGLASSFLRGPAVMSADPPFSPALTLFSAADIVQNLTYKDGFLFLPVGKVARTVNVKFDTIAPASLLTRLDYSRVMSAGLSREALLGLATVLTPAAVLRAIQKAVLRALDVRGITAAPAAISAALRDALGPVLRSAPTGAGMTSLPKALVDKAAALWESLTGERLALAGATRAAAPRAVGGRPTRARVLALRARDLHGLRAHRLPRRVAKAAKASLLTLPVSTRIRPLVAGRRLPRGGRALTLLGGGLRGKRAQLVIAGPRYTAVRTVRVVRGLAGGRVVLPRKRRAGRWFAGILDFGGLRTRRRGKLTAHAVLEAATWVARR